MNLGVAHVHDGNDTLQTLEDIGAEIYLTVDRMALRVGELLEHARSISSKRRYEAWVRDELPFGLDTAKRMRAIYLAYRELPRAALDQLPRPWQALYALAAVERPKLEAAIESGQLHPEMTVAETREAARELRGSRRPRVSQVDVWVARLVSLPVSELSDDGRERLGSWLSGSA